MKNLRNLVPMLVIATALVGSLAQAQQPLGSELERAFVHPPEAAKPHTWWHWMNGNLTKEGITRDLAEMKRVGLGGAQIFNVTDGILPGPVKFMSAEWRALVKHAVQEANRHGLELCIHNCAGWSSSGGPWVKPEQAMQMVVWSEVRVSGPKQFEGLLPQPPTRRGFYRDIAVLAFPTPPAEVSRLADLSPRVTASAPTFEVAKVLDGDQTTVTSLPKPAPGKPQFIQFEFPRPFQVRSLILIPGPGRNSHRGALQISADGQNFKTLRTFTIPRAWITQPILSLNFEPVSARFYRLFFTRGDPRAGQMTFAEIELHGGYRINNWAGKAGYVRTGGLEPDRGPLPPEVVIKRKDIVDLTPRMDAKGHLTWEVPTGQWTILRFGYTPTGKTNHPAPEEGRGLECDKMSREAVKAFFDAALGPILADIGPLAGRTLRSVLIDSYEVGCQNWTPRFGEEFRQRRGYDLLPYLPVMTGRVVESLEVSERFLWDLRRTIADLFADNYYGYFAQLCHQRGMLLLTEPYGNGLFNNLTCGGRSDLPMGEFWVGHFSRGTSKQAASVAHTYGRKIVGAESFTADAQHGRWQNHPYALKALGDFIYCAGVNRFIFHRYAHQPWLDRKPGMTMGPHGFHFEWTITWWEQAPAWLEYLSRCQYLLQQGLFVADACYFVGEGAPNGLPGRDQLRPRLPEGYDYDGCDDEVILKRLSVQEGKLVLPDGMSYRVLVLLDSHTMTPSLLRKIRELVLNGATLIGPKPVKSPSLQGYPEGDEEVKRLADEVWGDCDGERVTEHSFGRGKVIWGPSLEEVFAAMGLPPDFEYTSEDGNARLLYLHRRIGEVEVYFVSNQRERFEAVTCTFRVSGKAPELWHPDTGRVEKVPVFAQREGRVTMPLLLEPFGSVFVVFRAPIRPPLVVSATHHGQSLLQPQRRPAGRLEIRRAIYGVLEDPQKCVEVTEQLRRLVKNDTLSVEASNALAGDPAPFIVKKLRVDYALDGVLHTKIVNEHEILDLPEGSLSEYPAGELVVVGEGELELRAWEAGRYELQTASGQVLSIVVPSVPPPLAIGGPWELKFPPHWGAPERVQLDRLISWTEHSHPGIKYFSGTATYVKDLEIPSAMAVGNRMLSLDLGRVKYLAEVRLNGQDLGVLWKPPFRVDITKVARPGRNRLEVRVTNLWPNRLIGDEQFPDDREWSPGGALRAWPQWLLEGKPKPKTGRYTWTTWRHYTKASPLLESGLLGPVQVRVAVRQRVNLRK